MVAVLEVFAICGQLEVVHGRIGLFVDRILCHCICSMLLTAPLRHIFASTKFPQKGRHIVVGGNNKDRYAVFLCFSSKTLVEVSFLQISNRSSISSHGNASTRNHHFPSKSQSRFWPNPLNIYSFDQHFSLNWQHSLDWHYSLFFPSPTPTTPPTCGL